MMRSEHITDASGEQAQHYQPNCTNRDNCSGFSYLNEAYNVGPGCCGVFYKFLCVTVWVLSLVQIGPAV